MSTVAPVATVTCHACGNSNLPVTKAIYIYGGQEAVACNWDCVGQYARREKKAQERRAHAARTAA